mmetsp:Transcript_134634/g.200321  ORF Transcript_134634/g.200321 Transcript_134634/m.200321 type:complete len:101 (-) Transcript_134634:55-357(-)
MRLPFSVIMFFLGDEREVDLLDNHQQAIPVPHLAANPAASSTQDLQPLELTCWCSYHRIASHLPLIGSKPVSKKTIPPVTTRLSINLEADKCGFKFLALK